MKQLIIRIILVGAVLSVFAATMANEQWAPRPEDVTVIQTEQHVMYKYTDADGNVVVQGQPPPGFLNPRVVEEEDAPLEEAVHLVPEFKVEPPPVVKPPVSPWIMAALSALLLLAGLTVMLWQPCLRFLRESALERVIRKSGFPAFRDVVLPRNPGGNLTIDHVLHTPSGLLVLAEPEISGVVTGGPDLLSWSCGTKTERVQVPNPVLQVAANVNAVRQLAGNVPVFGRVVMTGKVSFPLKPPAEVQSLQMLVKSLPEFAAHATAERELGGAWRILMRYPRRADSIKHWNGVGAVAWLQRHQAIVAGALLLLLGVVSAVLATVFSG